MPAVIWTTIVAMRRLSTVSANTIVRPSPSRRMESQYRPGSSAFVNSMSPGLSFLSLAAARATGVPAFHTRTSSDAGRIEPTSETM
jgi:hypothetical protein